MKHRIRNIQDMERTIYETQDKEHTRYGTYKVWTIQNMSLVWSEYYMLVAKFGKTERHDNHKIKIKQKKNCRSTPGTIFLLTFHKLSGANQTCIQQLLEPLAVVVTGTQRETYFSSTNIANLKDGLRCTSSAMCTFMACRWTNSSSHTTFLVTRCALTWVQTADQFLILIHILRVSVLFPQL